jgi:hypothetical protein
MQPGEEAVENQPPLNQKAEPRKTEKRNSARAI